MKTDPIADWLLTEAPSARDLRTAFKLLLDQLEAAGFPILRAVVATGMLHPELMAVVYGWRRGDAFVKRTDIPHDIQLTEMYRNTPFQLLCRENSSIRRRLEGPDADIDSATIEEIRDLGGTDYIALALPRSDGQFNRCSFATDRKGGFTDAEIVRLEALSLHLGIVVELHGRASMTRNLLDLYLGPDAGPRVYGGQIRRGEGDIIHSVLFISDLRGFTRLSEEIPLEFLTAVLNDYFEAIMGPVHAHGGEVLKMIGDGILASFRIESEAETGDVCERALGAAELAMQNMALLNRRRGREGKPPLKCGIGLHVGDAIYGNVGAHDRLDFTVIGPAVNLCARLESLAGRLDEEIICSAEFVRHSADEFRSLGTHVLKNVEGQVEAFAPVM